MHFWDREGQPITELADWAVLYEARRSVARTEVAEGVAVSTIYMGHDMGFGMADRPLIFETMVFGGPLHHAQWRWPTMDDAIAGHDMVAHLAVLYATGALNPQDGRRP